MSIKGMVCGGAMQAKDARSHTSEIKSGAAKNSLTNPFPSRACISLQALPVSYERIINLDPDVRFTKSLYFIRFMPPVRVKDRRTPFIIGQDLVKKRIRFRDYEHFCRMADSIPELAFLKNYTTLTKEMFELSEEHPMLYFYFAIDYNKYAKAVEANSSSSELKNIFSVPVCDEEKYEQILKQADLVKAKLIEEAQLNYE